MSTLSVNVVNRQGETVGKIDIDPAEFGGEINRQLLHDVVVMYLANQRAGTHSTLRRGEVAGSTKKLFRQKGTGNARVGTRRTNKRRGGGTSKGPKPRDYEYHLPKKMFRAALRSALALKLKENQLNIVDAFSLPDHKTKALAQALTGLGFKRQVLVIDNQTNENLWRAARNMEEVSLIPNLQVTPYHLLNARHVVFSKSAIQALEEVLKK